MAIGQIRCLLAVLASPFVRLVNPHKIVFENAGGNGRYGCNQKAMTEAIRRKHPDWDLVWLVTNADRKVNGVPDDVRIAKDKSLRGYIELCTARVICTNGIRQWYRKRYGWKKRIGQVLIQTWHGSLGIKKVSVDYVNNPNLTKYYREAASDIDYLTANSDFEAGHFYDWFLGYGKILMCGHPRNDVLFRAEDGLREKVRADIGIASDVRMVLYAPTWQREEEGGAYLEDFAPITRVLARRFGGTWCVCVRRHPGKYGDRRLFNKHDGDGVIDVSAYPDMQELMVAADVIVTDYSSCIYDFALTGRPGFIYATNIKVYDAKHGLYFPLTSTPFPVAEDMEQLQRNIAEFDEAAYAQKLKEFLKEKGCIEDGHATERVVALIENVIDAG